MIIVYGVRAYGRADAIEGLGHVTCKFVHVMFVPLIPVETLFIVGDDRGMKLPFSFKAALSGWLRAGAILTGLGMIAGGIGAFADEEILLGIVCCVVGLISWAAFPLIGMLFGKCSRARRQELMSMMGLQDEHAAPSQHQPQQGPQPGYGQPAMGYGQGQQGPYSQPYPPPPMPYGPPPAGGFGQPAAYGAPSQGYGPSGMPPQHAGGYGAPPQQAYGAQQPYGGQAPQGYGAPPPPPAGYGPPGYDPNRR